MAEETEDKDVEIVIEPDAAPEDPTPEVVKVEAKPEAEKPAPDAADPEAALADFKAQLDASKVREENERQARLVAERRAAEAQGSVQDTEVSLVESAIAATKQTIAVQKADYAQALQDQDYLKVADIQEAMGTETARLLQLQGGLEHLKTRPKPQAQSQQIIDPVEAWAQQLGGQNQPNSANWIRQHPEYVRDQNLQRRLMAAANLAETDGLRIDSPEYIAAIEGTLRMTPSAAVETPRRQASPASAPVSRGPNGAGTKSSVVRLNADQREIAYMNWPELPREKAEQEYAKQLLKLQAAEGTMQ